MITRRAALAAAAASPFAGALPVRAQAFPSKPVRLVIPFPAGGIVDVVGRSVGERMSATLGQPVLADNRPGGNTAIATEIVAKSAPDGHTWILATVSHAVTPHLQKVEFDPLADFTGAAYLGNVPSIAVVPAASPFKTMAELIARAKETPGKLTYLSPGAGTSINLNMELVKLRTGADVAAVPYRGLPPGIPDLLEGRLDLALLAPVLATPHIRAGKLRALAVAGIHRHKDAPDVPTFAEAGLADSVVESWYVILVPARTPADAIARIHAAANEALRDPEVLKKLDTAGLVPPSAPVPSADVDALLRRDLAVYADLVKRAGIKAQ